MKKSTSRKVFEVCNIILLLLITIVSIYPLLNQIALSFSNSNGILNETVTIWPKGFNVQAYKTIITESSFWIDYKNTIIYTIVGTAVGVAMTTICSYALSKPHLVGGVVILKCMVFTMFFAGGLIPTYMLIKNLNMIDTMWALVIPGAIAPYNILLMKTFFQSLPDDLEDASRLDGLGQAGHFFRIALPLSKPILATITLFVSVFYWNDWFAALIYINDGAKHPVTLYLRNVMMGATVQGQNSRTIDASIRAIPQSIQAASMLLVVIPILLVYPFVQKYFVKGVMIGAIKG